MRPLRAVAAAARKSGSKVAAPGLGGPAPTAWALALLLGAWLLALGVARPQLGLLA